MILLYTYICVYIWKHRNNLRYYYFPALFLYDLRRQEHKSMLCALSCYLFVESQQSARYHMYGWSRGDTHSEALLCGMTRSASWWCRWDVTGVVVFSCAASATLDCQKPGDWFSHRGKLATIVVTSEHCLWGALMLNIGHLHTFYMPFYIT